MSQTFDEEFAEEIDLGINYSPINSEEEKELLGECNEDSESLERREKEEKEQKEREAEKEKNKNKRKVYEGKSHEEVGDRKKPKLTRVEELKATNVGTVENAKFIINMFFKSKTDITKAEEAIWEALRSGEPRTITNAMLQWKGTLMQKPDEVSERQVFADTIKNIAMILPWSRVVTSILRDGSLQFLSRIFKYEKQETNIDELILSDEQSMFPLMFALLSAKEKFNQIKKLDVSRVGLGSFCAWFDRTLAETLKEIIKEDSSIILEIRPEPYLTQVNYDVFFHVVSEYVANRKTKEIIAYFVKIQASTSLACDDITKQWQFHRALHTNVLKNYKNLVEITRIQEIYPEITGFLNRPKMNMWRDNNKGHERTIR